MELLQFRPALASISCAECQLYHHDYDWETNTGTGKRKMLGKPGVNERPALRAAGTPLPCQSQCGCAKESPEKEHEHVLSARNWQAWEFYRRVQATGVRALSEEAAADPIVQRNFEILDSITRAAERRRLAKEIAANLPVVILNKRK